MLCEVGILVVVIFVVVGWILMIEHYKAMFNGIHFQPLSPRVINSIYYFTIKMFIWISSFALTYSTYIYTNVCMCEYIIVVILKQKNSSFSIYIQIINFTFYFFMLYAWILCWCCCTLLSHHLKWIQMLWISSMLLFKFVDMIKNT